MISSQSYFPSSKIEVGTIPTLLTISGTESEIRVSSLYSHKLWSKVAQEKLSTIGSTVGVEEIAAKDEGVAIWLECGVIEEG